MSVENATKFLLEVEQNTELSAQIEKTNTLEECVEFACKQGYEFTKTDLQQVLAKNEAKELSEEQLEAVAGGTRFTILPYPGPGSCIPPRFPKFPKFSKLPGIYR